MLRRLGSNAVANIVNGIAVAVFQLAMTAIVAKSGDAQQLALWALAASIAGFAPLLSCNLVAVVTRRLASQSQDGEPLEVHQALVLNEAQLLSKQLTFAGLGIALLLMALVPIAYPLIIGNDILTSSVLVGFFFAGSCWVIFTQPEQGWLISTHRNWSIASANLGARLLALLVFYLLLAVVQLPYWLAVAFCSIALWSGVWILRLLAPLPNIAFDAGKAKKEQKKIRDAAQVFAIWSLASAITQAATIPIVAYIAPTVSPYVFLAFTLIAIIVAGISAAANAILAPLAKFLAIGDKNSALRITLFATAILWIGYMTASLSVYFLLDEITILWVDHTILNSQYKFCFILLAMQYGLRSTALIPSLVLAMGGKLRALFLLPIVEASSVLALAIPAAFTLGPYAFLLGLCLAGSVGAVTTTWYTASNVLCGEPKSERHRVLLSLVVFLQVLTLAVWGYVVYTNFSQLKSLIPI